MIFKSIKDELLMKCEKCGTISDVIYGKNLLCGKCGHLTHDAIMKDTATLLFRVPTSPEGGEK